MALDEEPQLPTAGGCSQIMIYRSSNCSFDRHSFGSDPVPFLTILSAMTKKYPLCSYSIDKL